jgi:hypothetical protein
MNIDAKILKTDIGGIATLTTTDMSDRTASYCIPQMASNNVSVNITGGCEYCKAGKGIMNHYGIDFYAFARIENGRFEMAYSNNIRGDGLVAGHKAVKINYCPMCGRRMDEDEKID